MHFIWRALVADVDGMESDRSPEDVFKLCFGLTVGIAGIAYFLAKASIGPEGRRELLSIWILSLFDIVAAVLTDARLRLWKLIPRSLRRCTHRFCGTRYCPASQVNRTFVLRHSNFSEKLRWILELSGESFHEVPVAIFFVRPTARYHMLGASNDLPIVTTKEGRGLIRDPATVVANLSKARWRAWMYPDGARELEETFEQNFGNAAMHVAYAYLFTKEMRRYTIEMFSRGLPLWQRVLVPILGVGVMARMSDSLKLTERIPTNMRAVEKYFSLVEDTLGDGRLFLCGDTISAADIAFASLAFPLLLPDEAVDIFVPYDPRILPTGYVEIIKSLRARVGGRFALRLYTHKRWRGSFATPLERSPNRGRSFTVKENINSLGKAAEGSRQGRRATVIGMVRESAKPVQVPKNTSPRRSTIVGNARAGIPSFLRK